MANGHKYKDKSKGNGTIWKVISIGITIVIIAAGIIYGYADIGHQVGDNCEDIKEMKPDVGKNTEHRIQDEVDTRYIKEKISNIETVQQQILTAVQNK